MEAKPVRIGVVGYGTVGGGTVRLLLSERDRIRAATGVDLQLVRVADTLKDPHPDIALPPGALVHDFRAVIDDPAVDIVIELVGGTGVAYQVIAGALKNKKHVVTANKALLAEKGAELFPLARENGCVLAFEAAVCGAIPVIRAIKEGLSGSRILSLHGILNGTANFILTKMRFEKKDFATALKQAQALGFAEADPTFDVEGIDSAHKLALLASLCFGRHYDWRGFQVCGITRITDLDIQYAAEMGCVIKLLALARLTENGLPFISVAPALIPVDSILAEVNHEFNGILIETEAAGPMLFTGRGAGALPTGSAVLSDLVHLAAYGSLERDAFRMYPEGPDGPMVAADDFVAEHYIRLSAADRPGVMAKISGALGEHGVSIAMLLQKQAAEDGSAVIVIKTHRIRTRNLDDALKVVDALDIVTGPSLKIRILNQLT
ncbi:MAG: homoserine dehydrogenase [Fibrobacterota bacterium]